MRKPDAGAKLLAEEAAAADTGLKAMIPVGQPGSGGRAPRRPFLDYLLNALADSGFTAACIVIGREHEMVRARYEHDVVPSRIKVSFAMQERALGTANAVISAEAFASGDSFAVLNSDNYYPAEALDALRSLAEPAIVGFDRDVLVRLGNVPSERTARFGALDIGDDGYLRRILVSPTEEMLRSGMPIYSSMNCFLFTKEIFPACRNVPLSARGEYELPQAVHFAIDRYGIRFKVVKVAAPVLDMSTRGDIALVREYLKGIEISL